MAADDVHDAAMIVAGNDVAPGRGILHLREGEAADPFRAPVDADQVARCIVHRDRGVDVIDDEIDERILVDRCAAAQSWFDAAHIALARHGERHCDLAEPLP
jgi:hypothetical protein